MVLGCRQLFCVFLVVVRQPPGWNRLAVVSGVSRVGLKEGFQKSQMYVSGW